MFCDMFSSHGSLWGNLFQMTCHALSNAPILFSLYCEKSGWQIRDSFNICECLCDGFKYIKDATINKAVSVGKHMNPGFRKETSNNTASATGLHASVLYMKLSGESVLFTRAISSSKAGWDGCPPCRVTTLAQWNGKKEHQLTCKRQKHKQFWY